MRIPKIDKYIFKKINLVFNSKILKRRYIKIDKGPIKGFRWVNLVELYRYSLGTHEEELTDKLVSLLKPSSVFYDIGANVGYYSIIASQIVEGGEVYAFEPIPASRTLMNEHIDINNISNVNVLSYGVSDEIKKVSFTNSSHLSANSYILEGDTPNDGDMLEVECISIDSGISEKGFKPPSIIKIDVEGAEFDVLKGAKETIKKYKPIIFLATHDSIVEGVTQSCISFLENLGYDVSSTDDLKETSGQFDFYCEPKK